MALRPVDGPKDFILEDEEEKKTDEIEHGNSDISDLSHCADAAANVSKAPALPTNRPECYHQLSRTLLRVRQKCGRQSWKQDATSRVKTFRTTPRGRDKIDEAVVFELKWTEDMKDTEKRVIVGRKFS
jgi:hypothetical protein